jgi:hypothetical protein
MILVSKKWIMNMKNKRQKTHSFDVQISANKLNFKVKRQVGNNYTARLHPPPPNPPLQILLEFIITIPPPLENDTAKLYVKFI